MWLNSVSKAFKKNCIYQCLPELKHYHDCDYLKIAMTEFVFKLKKTDFTSSKDSESLTEVLNSLFMKYPAKPITLTAAYIPIFLIFHPLFTEC